MKRADTCVLNLLFQVRLGKGSKIGVEMASSQLVEIQPSVVVLFRRRYLIVRMVCCQVFGAEPIANGSPLAKFIFINRLHVSFMISVASISLHQHLHSL